MFYSSDPTSPVVKAFLAEVMTLLRRVKVTYSDKPLSCYMATFIMRVYV
jgi:hypothetical protein